MSRKEFLEIYNEPFTGDVVKKYRMIYDEKLNGYKTHCQSVCLSTSTRTGEYLTHQNKIRLVYKYSKFERIIDYKLIRGNYYNAIREIDLFQIEAFKELIKSKILAFAKRIGL